MVPPAEEGGKGLCAACSTCRLCLLAETEVQLPPPIGSRDTRYHLPACNACAGKLLVMLWDLPWLRYQMTQYRQVLPGTKNYNPEGVYFGP